MTRRFWGQVATTIGFSAWAGPSVVLFAFVIPPMRQLLHLPHAEEVILTLAWAFLLLPPVASTLAWFLAGPQTLLRHCATLQLLAWLVAIGLTLLVTTS